MPKPIGGVKHYVPGLDGLRTIAVALVIAYHLHVPHAGGGLLGVGIFFTLSGFLITSILLSGAQQRGWDLRSFWVRRARRLLPAVVLLLIVTMVATVIRRPGETGTWGVDAIAALFYVANWHTILAGDSYFARFNTGPFDHLWSLSVEEQFYLVWPLLLIALWFVTRRHTRVMAVITALLAAASFVELSMLAKSGFDTTRAYEGTDTRVGGLLVGAALALWLHGRRERLPEHRRAIDVAGVLGLVVIGVLVSETTEYDLSTYRFGLLALSVATGAVLLAISTPGSILGRVLALRPLTWIGERSYGIYLWHLPILVFMPTNGVLANGLAHGAAVVILTVLISALSWRYVEDPIRTLGLRAALRRRGTTAVEPILPPEAVIDADATAVPLPGQIPGAVRLPVRPHLAAVTEADETAPLPVATPVAAPVSAAPVAATPVDVARARVLSRRLNVRAGSAMVGALAVAVMVVPQALPLNLMAASDAAAAPASPTPTSPGSVPTGSAKPSGGGSPSSSATPSVAIGGPGVLQSSCTHVVHVGDSTSDGLLGNSYIPNPAQQYPQQLRDVGVTSYTPEISGGRSIVETLDGHPNAATVVQQQIAAGYHGCWVFALGTNDTADQAVGGNVSLPQRISRLMQLVGSDDVLWVNVRVHNPSNPAYSEANMQKWNNALLDACKKYPTMRVANWADQVQNKWFISDGIHFTTPGYIARAHDIAQALAVAFPKGGHSPSQCLVQGAPTPTS
ncbi:acyltransferase family protein [Rudaeicoccus suwonensis]|uniref:Peptidoglycan/LPS O-acetylase OafA/YrhL n=1 Tax=Rudaeicoccus suwonensis TaxID=657409 RepID=A0A561ECL9_9MICO|nr:acyltransferase family protein [Rudaeicoccus suwonensis]TWE13352.1 peptidoglycan/LPS O-acetylase OafA/YrhL [Rudaeicoccus suwonensis]